MLASAFSPLLLQVGILSPILVSLKKSTVVPDEFFLLAAVTLDSSREPLEPTTN